jgi:Spx/MgsR family transcriptional regulator
VANLTVYHYPACSTCRKALKWLAEQGIAYEPRNIVDEPPSARELARVLRLLARTGGPGTEAREQIRALFNTSGESYRSGRYKERLPHMDQQQALAALAADGKLIKRPLVVGEDLALVGFQEAAWRRALAVDARGQTDVVK